MADTSDPVAVRLAETVINWRRGLHPAGGREVAGRHVGLLDELTALVNEKIRDRPMQIRLLLSDGDFDLQVRAHLITVLAERLRDERDFEAKARDLMEAALSAALDEPRAGQAPSPSAEDWWKDEGRDRRGRVLLGPRRRSYEVPSVLNDDGEGR